LNQNNIYSNAVLGEFTSNQNAHINFYRSRNYNIDRKFKSFGSLGETRFHIGPSNIFTGDYDDDTFHGVFPEFISFEKELSANERNRVESYLALKYGITLNEKNLTEIQRILFFGTRVTTEFLKTAFLEWVEMIFLCSTNIRVKVRI
jgi:hypothetical protein